MRWRCFCEEQTNEPRAALDKLQNWLGVNVQRWTLKKHCVRPRFCLFVEKMVDRMTLDQKRAKSDHESSLRHHKSNGHPNRQQFRFLSWLRRDILENHFCSQVQAWNCSTTTMISFKAQRQKFVLCGWFYVAAQILELKSEVDRLMGRSSAVKSRNSPIFDLHLDLDSEPENQSDSIFNGRSLEGTVGDFEWFTGLWDGIQMRSSDSWLLIVSLFHQMEAIFL